MTDSSSYCSYSHCPRMKTFTSLLKGNVPSSLRKRYSSLASLNTGLLSQTTNGSQAFILNVLCKWSHSDAEYRWHLNMSLLPLLPRYRGEWCRDPSGAAGGWQQLLDPEPPCGSRSSPPAPALRSSWGTFADGSVCLWSVSHRGASALKLRFGGLKCLHLTLEMSQLSNHSRVFNKLGCTKVTSRAHPPSPPYLSCSPAIMTSPLCCLATVLLLTLLVRSIFVICGLESKWRGN